NESAGAVGRGVEHAVGYLREQAGMALWGCVRGFLGSDHFLAVIPVHSDLERGVWCGWSGRGASCWVSERTSRHGPVGLCAGVPRVRSLPCSHTGPLRSGARRLVRLVGAWSILLGI